MPSNNARRMKREQAKRIGVYNPAGWREVIAEHVDWTGSAHVRARAAALLQDAAERRAGGEVDLALLDVALARRARVTGLA